MSRGTEQWPRRRVTETVGLQQVRVKRTSGKNHVFTLNHPPKRVLRPGDCVSKRRDENFKYKETRVVRRVVVKGRFSVRCLFEDFRGRSEPSLTS